MFATLMGSVAAIVMGERILKARVTEQMDALNDYFGSKNIPQKLRTQVRVFLEDVYEREAFDCKKMLDALPSEMRFDMQLVLYKDLQEKVRTHLPTPQPSTQLQPQLQPEPEPEPEPHFRRRA